MLTPGMYTAFTYYAIHKTRGYIDSDLSFADSHHHPLQCVFSGVQAILLGAIKLGRCYLEPYTTTKWHVMIR